MARKTGIGWTHHTWNPWWGCHKVSAACTYCYIAAMMRKAGKEPFAGPIRTKDWDAPRRFNRAAIRAGQRRRVFTCSMSDFFHDGADQWRPEAWEIIQDCTWLDWLILTKRSERVLDCLPGDWGSGYPNVWLGVTCEDSKVIHRAEELLRIPAQLKFISAEPLLGPLDLRAYLAEIDWVITGCEQAAKGKRRPMDFDWVRDLDRQCREFGKPHFFKQYYKDDSGWPLTDGLLDGEFRQAFPKSPGSHLHTWYAWSTAW